MQHLDEMIDDLNEELLAGSMSAARTAQRAQAVLQQRVSACGMDLHPSSKAPCVHLPSAVGARSLPSPGGAAQRRTGNHPPRQDRVPLESVGAPCPPPPSKVDSAALHAFLCDEDTVRPATPYEDEQPSAADSSSRSSALTGSGLPNPVYPAAVPHSTAPAAPGAPSAGLLAFVVEQSGLRVRTSWPNATEAAITGAEAATPQFLSFANPATAIATIPGGAAPRCTDGRCTAEGCCAHATASPDDVALASVDAAARHPTRTRGDFGQTLPGGVLSSLRKTVSDVVSHLRALGSGGSGRTGTAVATAAAAQLASHRASVDSALAAATAEGAAPCAASRGPGRIVQQSPPSVPRSAIRFFRHSTTGDTGSGPSSVITAAPPPPPSPALVLAGAPPGAPRAGRMSRLEGSQGSESLPVVSSWLAGALSSSAIWGGQGGRDSAGSAGGPTARAGASMTTPARCLGDPQGSVDLLPDMWDLARALDEVDDGFPASAPGGHPAAAPVLPGSRKGAAAPLYGRLSQARTAPVMPLSDGSLGCAAIRLQSQHGHHQLHQPEQPGARPAAKSPAAAPRDASSGFMGAAAAAFRAVASPASGSYGNTSISNAGRTTAPGMDGAAMSGALRGHDAEQLYVLSELVQQGRASASFAAARPPRARFQPAQPAPAGTTAADSQLAPPKRDAAAAWLASEGSPFICGGFRAERESRGSASGCGSTGSRGQAAASVPSLAGTGAHLPFFGCAASGGLSLADPLCASAPSRLVAGSAHATTGGCSVPLPLLTKFASSATTHYETALSYASAQPGASAEPSIGGGDSTAPAALQGADGSTVSNAAVMRAVGDDTFASSLGRCASPSVFGPLGFSSGPLGSTSSVGLLGTGPELAMIWPLVMPTPVPAVLVGAQEEQARCAGRSFLLNVLVACACGCGSSGCCTAAPAAAPTAGGPRGGMDVGAAGGAAGRVHAQALRSSSVLKGQAAAWVTAAAATSTAAVPGTAGVPMPSSAVPRPSQGPASQQRAARLERHGLVTAAEPQPPPPRPRVSVNAMLSGIQLAQVQIDRAPGGSGTGSVSAAGGQAAMLRLPLLPAMQLVNVFAASGADVGPAASLLAVPPLMASELHALFMDKVERSLSDLLGKDRVAAESLRGDSRGRHGGGAAAIGALRTSAVATRVRRELATLRESSPSAPPWTMSVPVWAACRAQWRSWLQPLLHDICYLLLCVPNCFAHGLVEWDRVMYCETLARMLGQLERHKLWQTLSVLLEYCSRQGVALLYQGQAVGAGCLGAERVRAMLEGALYDEISIKAIGLGAPTGGRVGDDGVCAAAAAAAAAKGLVTPSSDPHDAATAAAASGRGRRASVAALVTPDAADAAAALTLRVWGRRSVDTPVLGVAGAPGAAAGAATGAGPASASPAAAAAAAVMGAAGARRPPPVDRQRPTSDSSSRETAGWPAAPVPQGPAFASNNGDGGALANRPLPSQASIGPALGRVLSLMACGDGTPAADMAAAAVAGVEAGPPAAAGQRLGHMIENAAVVLAFVGLMLQSLL